MAKTKKDASHKPEDVEARLADIVRLRNLYEYTWPEVGERVDMHPDAARALYAKWLNGSREAILLEDETELIQRKLYTYGHLKRRLIDVTDEKTAMCPHCGKNCGHEHDESVTIRGVETLLKLDRQEVVTRQLTGLLPRDIAAIRSTITGRKFMAILFEILDEHLPTKKAIEIEEAFAARIERGTSQKELEAAGEIEGDAEELDEDD